MDEYQRIYHDYESLNEFFLINENLFVMLPVVGSQLRPDETGTNRKFPILTQERWLLSRNPNLSFAAERSPTPEHRGAYSDEFLRFFGIYSCIASHKEFFNELIDVDEVTVIGHSLGKVDYPYFKLVMHKVKPNARWTVFYHTPEERATLIASLNELGLSNTCCNLLPTSEFWD